MPSEEGHPVQGLGHVSSCVTERAYEVYKHRYGDRQTLERLNERGGFHTSELITLLYARGFPKDEWTKRDDDAMRGLKIQHRP